MTPRSKWIYAGMLALATLLLDQFTKWWMLEKIALPLGRAIDITPFFNLVMVRNYGVSFGMFANGHEYGRWLLVALALTITGIMGWLLAKSTHRLAITAQSLIIGGAIGNVIDRIRHGAVIDFLDFHWHIHHWPAFNVADAAIVCGVTLLLIDGIVHTPDAAPAAQDATRKD